MIYRPIATRFLWDTWIFPHDGRYHLFYIEAQDSDDFDHVGRAVSDNLIHWETLPSIHTCFPDSGLWDSHSTLTGMVIWHENRFYLFVGAYKYKAQEVVGVYTSDDLVNWHPHSSNPVLVPKSPYLVNPDDAPYKYIDWRDPCIFWLEDDKSFHAFLCARLPGWNDENTGAAIAHVRSKDMVNWEHLSPIVNASQFYNMEVPDVFELNGRCYLLFSSGSIGGLCINTPTRDTVKGTFYMVGSSLTGPFEFPDNPLLLGAGQRLLEPYVGRTIPYQNGRLLYHHTRSSRPVLGMPKKVYANENGQLFLEYFPEMKKLENGVIFNSLDDIMILKCQDMGNWGRKASSITGKSQVAGSACAIAKEIADAHFACSICNGSARRAGIILRSLKSKKGVAILLDYEKQQVQICSANDYDRITGWTILLHDMCRQNLVSGQKYNLRCFMRSEFYEAYLNEKWIFSSVLEGLPQRGDIQLYVEGGSSEFSELRAALIEPLP